MRKIAYFLLVIALITTSFSCIHIKEKEGKLVQPEENRLKGTDSEIMNAFKSALSGQEIDKYDIPGLKIVTKLKKLDESYPDYETYKMITDIYEQFEIVMKRENNEMVVDVKYSILTQELNMKTGKVDYVVIARLKEVEQELLRKAKKILYGY